MIRIPIIVIAFYLSIVSAFAQAPADTSNYYSRKLKLEEVNFVSSYYHQEGNNAAVTGGVGSERLTDVVTVIDFHMTRRDKKNRLHNYTAELGMDSYTSASSDKIDPSTISSASASDERYYPTFDWSVTNDDKRKTVGASLAGSFEYDYYSVGAGIYGSKNSKDKSRQASLKLQTFQDRLTLIYPIELRSGRPSGQRSRNTYTISVGLSQIINTRLQVMLLLDLAYQEGFLSLPFNRVYFNDNTEAIEKLPGARFKIPIGLRANYFLGDRIILRGFYRYYWDDWNIVAHTAELETSIKITPLISVTPFYRYYTQSQARYFAPFQANESIQRFFTSDYDLSKFNSHFAGIGLRAISVGGIFGLERWKMVEIRYGHYERKTGLVSNVISMQMRFNK
jgi:hypothetical protein